MRIPVKDLRPGMVLGNDYTVVSVKRRGGAILLELQPPLAEQGDTTSDLQDPDASVEVQAVDLTPSWSALVLPLAKVYTNPEADPKNRALAEESLLQVARLADMYVGALARSTGDTGGLGPGEEATKVVQ